MLALFALQIGAYLILQIPSTQTWLANKVVDAVSKNINGDINIGKVYIVFFNRLVLNNVSIAENAKKFNNYKDTLLQCQKLAVTFSPLEIIKGNIKINSVSIANGFFNLQNDSTGQSNLKRIFSSNKEKDTTSKMSLNIIANSLKINNFRFILQNPDKYVYKDPRCMNFSDLDVNDIYLNINSISLKEDSLRANIKNIRAKEKSGFNLKTLEGELLVTSNLARIRNLCLQDDHSSINAKYISLGFNSTEDFSDFVNKVRMGADFYDTYINFATIGSFAPSMLNSSLAFNINGELQGRVNNLRTKSLEVTSETGLTYLNLDAHLSGLPDVPTTMASININKCYTTTNDIANIISSLNNKPKIEFLTSLAPFVRYNFTASLNGLLYDFVVNGKLNSTIGNIDVDILLDASPEQQKDGIKIDGYVKTNDFNIGKLINNKMLGSVSLNGNVITTLKDAKQGGININLKNLEVSKFGFNDYEYQNIMAAGNYSSSSFDGKIICHDPNLDFIFQGLFSLDLSHTSKYDFFLDLPYANLNALNFDKRDKISEVGLITSANFTQTAKKDITGSISIKNPYFKNTKGEFFLGDISLDSDTEGSNVKAKFMSQFVNADYNGNIPVSTFVTELINTLGKSTVSNYLLTASNLKSKDKSGSKSKQAKKNNGNHTPDNTGLAAANIIDLSGQKAELDIHINDTKGLFEAILPQLYIAPNSTVKASIDNQASRLIVNADAIAYDNNLVSNLSVNINKNDSLLDSRIKASQLFIKGIQLDSARIGIDGCDNNINCHLSFINDSSQTKAKLNSNVQFVADNNQKIINIGVDSSSIEIKGEKWNVTSPMVSIIDSTIIVDNFRMDYGNQSLNVKGRLSKTEKDSLRLDLNKFNISLLNEFMKKDFDFKGYLSGVAEFYYLNRKPNFNINMVGDSVFVAGHEAGKIAIKSGWDYTSKRIDIQFANMLNNKPSIQANGWFRPDSSTVNIDVNLNEFSPAYFAPYLAGVVSKINGSISGDLNLKGSLKKPELYGKDVVLNDLGFTVDFVNVPYILNGPISITPQGVVGNNTSMRDTKGGTGTLNGGLKFSYFKDIKLDTRINFKNIMALDTQDSNDAAFYGTAFATGSLTIKGPFDKIKLGIDALTNKNTSLHIPLSNASTASQTNILTFVEPQRADAPVPLDSLIAATRPAASNSQMDITMRMNVTPDAEISIEINKEVGDVIKANGTGLINMQVSPWRDLFNMFGDYTINQGSYKFVVLGLAAKDFTVQPGGTINFNGGIENTNLNLNAVYKTKASINTLIADTSSVGTRRLVECILGMSGQLMNPELSFSINIPDLDPTVKAQVESALSIEGQRQKQFMALLVSGGFIPNEQSGIANNSTILYSNASEILSNQLNNILQQLGIPIDLGLNYARGDKGTNVFDVAISTTLFNNRVIVSGNMGNDPSSATNRDVIGNFDVEIKLDKNGRLRLNLFSHATDSYSNSLDYSQRNGVGIVYQQGFDNFRQLFRKRTPEERAMRRQINEKEKLAREQRKQNKEQQDLQNPQ